MKIALVILAVVAGFGGAYGWLQHKTAEELVSSGEELKGSLALARSQTEALTAKVNALSAAQAQQEAALAQAEAAKNPSSPPTVEGATRKSTVHTARRRAADDPRWKQVQQQLGEEQKALNENREQLAETQANLQQAKSELAGNLDSARQELGSGIARNHDELVALEKKGERNYFEFDISKAKGYHHAGPINISLRKADAKHGYCDLDMTVNDKALSKKHVNLYESVAFYPEGDPTPVQLVINRIGKDFVHGYVSEAKYRSTGQVAVAANSPRTEPAGSHDTEPVSPPPPAVPEPQLEHRTNEIVH